MRLEGRYSKHSASPPWQNSKRARQHSRLNPIISREGKAEQLWQRTEDGDAVWCAHVNFSVHDHRGDEFSIAAEVVAAICGLIGIVKFLVRSLASYAKRM